MSLPEMFSPDEDPPGSERRTVADQPIVLYKPKRKTAGLTFLLTAANIPLSKYASIIAALNSVDHTVVGFFVNVFNPPLRSNHRVKAEKIPQIFDEIKDEFRVGSYYMVGHSVGAKIALLVAALYDEERLVKSIIGLDPVDQSPVEFTNALKLSEGSKLPSRENITLQDSEADITLTFTNTGYFISKEHTSREIQRNNPAIKLVSHRNSCHMVYCDTGGILSWKALMGSGSRDKSVKEDTIKLIKDQTVRKMSAGAKAGVKTKSMKSSLEKAKNAVAQNTKDIKNIGEEAKNKGKMYSKMAKMGGMFK